MKDWGSYTHLTLARANPKIGFIMYWAKKPRNTGNGRVAHYKRQIHDLELLQADSQFETLMNKDRIAVDCPA